MRMLNDNVLVAESEDKQEKDRVTEGGIILTGAADHDKSSKPATVLAVGPLVLDIEQGDTVFLDWAYTMPVTVAGNKAFILQVKYVKAVMQVHSLHELRKYIESKHKKKPKEFDGITLIYPNVTFSLCSVFRDESLVEVWSVTKKKETQEFTAKQLKANLDNLIKK